MDRSSMAMQPGFDIDQLWREAQVRWLKPAEVLFILQNHDKYTITMETPKQPPSSGSFFLYNRRVLRYFRKDGHMWRKKKDGRTIGEAHERLKVGNVDTLNCYYAHGEQNPYFQRRSYWMLDPAYEHIVLVHYREVAEGRYVSGERVNLSAESLSIFSQSSGITSMQPQSFMLGSSDLLNKPLSNSSGSLEEVSSEFLMENPVTDHLKAIDSSRQPEVNRALRKLAEQLSLDDENDVLKEKLFDSYIQYNESQDSASLDCELRMPTHAFHETALHVPENRMLRQTEDNEKKGSYGNTQSLTYPGDNGAQYSFERKQSPSWNDTFGLTSYSGGISTNGVTSNFLAREIAPKSCSSRTVVFQTQHPFGQIVGNEDDNLLSSMRREKISENLLSLQSDQGVSNRQEVPDGYQLPESDLALQLSATRTFLLGSDNPAESLTSVSELSEVERLHISGTASLQADTGFAVLTKENSTEWMGDIALAMENNMYSFDPSLMFDPGQSENFLRTDLSLTLAQKQLFSIREISPEWAFSSGSTKVIIIGDFLCNSSEFPWAIMFDDIEVPAQIIQEGVLCCQVPQHGAGIVTLCVTSGDRESCSEIRQFKFLSKPNTSNLVDTSPQGDATTNDELLLLARFTHMVLCGFDYSSTSKVGVESEFQHSENLKTCDSRWAHTFQVLQQGHQSSSEALDWILQELLKDKFQQWLVSRYQGKDGDGCLLTKQDEGIIHMIAGLGYEWALSPILNFGVGINFRDVNGWTALHWAAHFGREKMVAALLAAGASAGAVTDPTPQDPLGKTPGAISASRGHKGLAGYLSEVAITSHLTSLTMEESEVSKGSAAVEAERAIESISQRRAQINVGGTEDELSLKDSLAAVRNTAQAAARIQAAFRAHSFRKRQQQTSGSEDDYGMSPDDIRGLSAASRFQRSSHGYREQKFDRAALSIQKKFRGWKGRRDFLVLRQHVVKIQAHVRGHQVREKFKKFLWTVGVVEKAILRWRRKGVGLRGYRPEPEMFDEPEDEDIVKIFRKQKVDLALDEAVSTVLSMVDSPNARQQYRRMLEKYNQAKDDLNNADEATSTTTTCIDS